ncbi:MAG: ABC transporter permease, partial [Gemmatimonadota bacterium]
MRRIAELRVRLNQLLGRSEAEERMDEEIRFHIEMETEKNIRGGMDPSEARRRALLAFGSVEDHRETMRGGRRFPLEDAFREAWHVVRSLFRSRSFATVCILTIGVAIGATTAIFSVVDAVLLRPLPYPDAEELVTVRLGVELEAREDISFSDRGFWHFHGGNRSFERFGGFTTTQHPLVGDGDPLQVDAAPMTVEAFEAVGIAPVLGRLPTSAEDVPNGPDLALISSGLWVERYGGDTGILGRVIRLGSRPFEVIGVMPADFDFPTPETDVWYPYRLDPASDNFGGHHIQAVARLRDGVSLESARSDAASLIRRFGEAGYGPEWTGGTFTGEATIETIPEQVVGASRRPLYILLGTVGFVLLIACGNVANLLLVRAESRSRERAVR